MREPRWVEVSECGDPRWLEALIGENQGRGTDPDWSTAGCRWKRPDDIPLEVLERAYEAA